MSLNYKSTAQINTLIYNADNMEYTMTYTSSDPAIATVDGNGKVTATKSGTGTATITCTLTGAD